MTILAWIIVLPLFLALIAQVAFCVIGLSGLGSALCSRVFNLKDKKVPVTRA